MSFEHFHFLRPEWLALLTPLPVMGWAWYRHRESSGWERVCEPHLLLHLLASGSGSRARLWDGGLFALGWLGGCVALAGPTWERLPQPTFEESTRTVFVLGLPPSMDERDVAPSRMARARHKLTDALGQLSGGSAALVVYREEAFAAVPLTDDLRVLEELIPLLETNLAPGRRVFPARGIEAALGVLKPIGVAGAQILLLTDGSDDNAVATLAAARQVAQEGGRLSVLGIAGSRAELEAIAHAGGGEFVELRADDRDLAGLLGEPESLLGTPLQRSPAQTDAWRDMGVWLVWIPLVFAPLAFRRGWATAALVILALQLPAGSAHADVFDWFERPDQRGARAFADENYEASADAFEDPAWQAAARYRAGECGAAAETLAGRLDAQSNYNRGNALARARQFEEALAAYDASLAVAPDDEDARFNRELVERLLERQTQQRKQEERERGSNSQHSESGDANDEENSDAGEENSNVANPSHDSEAQEPGAGDPTAADSTGDAPRELSEMSEPSEPADQGEGEPAQPTTSDDAGGPNEQSDQRQAAEPPGDPRQAEGDEPGADAGDRSTETESPSAQTTGRASAGSPVSPQEQDIARWMARLPDDPGGLLREKIRRDYVRKRQLRQEGRQQGQLR